jgi:hypothetical protein
VLLMAGGGGDGVWRLVAAVAVVGGGKVLRAEL